MKKRIMISIILMIILPVQLLSQESQMKAVPLHLQVAEAHGVDNFINVTRVGFTFNAVLGDKLIERKWEWFPKQNRVVYYDKKDDGNYEPISYNRDRINEIDNFRVTKIDADFINDQYWLLFPFHLKWDDNVKFENEGIKESPFSGKELKKLVVKYGDVGYTPGDVFILYLDEDNIIREWNYKKGGSDKKSKAATWEAYKEYNGMKISHNHYGSDPNRFQVYFTNVDFDFEDK